MQEKLRVSSTNANSALIGDVHWSPKKSLWFISNLLLTILIAPFLISFSAFAVFLTLTAVTLCLGHSLGMHRLMIHRSYECPKWMEYLFVYLGVLVGMAGPIGMLKQHDLRDWAQRRKNCHDYLKHGKGILVDAWWQLNCDLKLQYPPQFKIEDRISDSKFYQFVERTWLLQQLCLAIPLFFIGGLSWVAWGISVRVVVSVGGHWLIGYFAHNQGQRTWKVKGAAVQGHNIKIAAFLSMGESLHNNHHAYPGSAMLGLHKDEPDPGWWVLNKLYNLGLVKNIVLPNDLPKRPELVMESQQIETREKRTLEPCPLMNGIRG